MPVFDAKSLNSTFEGQDLLAAILHPTRVSQVRARMIGRRRVSLASAFAAPETLESRFAARPDALVLAQDPAN